MSIRLAVTCATILAACGPTAAQRSWIIQPNTREGGGWVDVPSGGYDNAAWYYGSGFDGVRRGYWKFDTPFAVGSSADAPPDEPRLYYIEQWVPALPQAVPAWDWLPIEVNFSSKDVEPWPNNPAIPWGGAFGQNHQWIGMDLNDPPNTFEQAGPGPQAPNSAACGASGTGLHVWMRRGSWLYTKWNFGFGPGPHAITALRITEVEEYVPTPCGPASNGGPVDLRCVGNADPLYATGEYYVNSASRTVDGNTLTTDGYVKPTCFTPGQNLVPGLPANGQYTAQLAEGDVDFLLRYDGLNTIKWRNDGSGTFSRSNIYTLNGVPGREFVPGHYDKLYFLGTKGGGSAGRLRVEAVFDDSSTQAINLNLYDWFNQDGDATTIAVGEGGRRRSEGGTGFRRLNDQGESAGGQNLTSGAFLFVFVADIDESKTLNAVNLWLDDDTIGSFGGELVIFTATFELGLGCSTPVFDVAGAGVGGGEPDGAVDQSDFAAFQRCITGPPPAPTFDFQACGCFDVTGDSAVDANDFSYFLDCATGPASGTPPPAGCDQP